MRRFVLPAAIAVALATAAPAGALIEPGNVSALPGNPYPTQPGVTVNGTLETNQPPGPGGTPQDYLKFTVASAGETIEFTDQNTTTGIDPGTCDSFCPVYLSIVNQSFMDPGASVGTVATYADTEIFDWTFQSPGTYYMVVESDGDVNLSYAVSYRPGPSSGSGTCTGGCTTSSSPPTSPLVRMVRVLPRQSGTAVKSVLSLGQWARTVRVSLLYGRHLRSIASVRKAPLGPGHHRFKLALPSGYKRMLRAKRELSLVERISVLGSSGVTQTFNRRVTLKA